MKHARKEMLLERYPSGTPVWKAEMDDLNYWAKQEEAKGHRFRAWRLRKKAEKVFKQAGGKVVKVKKYGRKKNI